ncbi:hypothetical protein RhiirA4_484672 [Rhizophagus irregularis]|uniref:RNase H type-1 domain-containing protein n=1 Tax=Rhizophagus irregularis TaxID=588596 RepID=A0A2I1HPA6_9GLOM|nr:hypothetical protein RhiirA4_484672 [Rhizophagus irregularis]
MTSITTHTSVIVATVSWAEIVDFVTTYFNRLSTRPDFSAIIPPALLSDTATTIAASLSVVISPDSTYTFYTDGSLINLGTNEASMGWGWVQIVQDSGFLNSIATYTHGIIRDWPSSSCAEAAAIYAALSASPADSVIKIYTDSQTAIDGLRHFKAHSNFYWNDFADSLANTAHTADDSVLISRLDLVAAHDFILEYDNVVCESNPRQL